MVCLISKCQFLGLVIIAFVGLLVETSAASAQEWESQRRWVTVNDPGYPAYTHVVSADQNWALNFGCSKEGPYLRLRGLDRASLPRGDNELNLAVDGRSVGISADLSSRNTFRVVPDRAVMESFASGGQAVFSVNGLDIRFTLEAAGPAIGEAACRGSVLAGGLTEETQRKRDWEALFMMHVPPSLYDDMALLARGTISVNNLPAIVTIAKDLYERCGPGNVPGADVGILSFIARHYDANLRSGSPEISLSMVRTLAAAREIPCGSPFHDAFFDAILTGAEANRGTRFESECRKVEPATKCRCRLEVLESIDPKVSTKPYVQGTLDLVRERAPMIIGKWFGCETSD